MDPDQVSEQDEQPHREEYNETTPLPVRKGSRALLPLSARPRLPPDVSDVSDGEWEHEDEDKSSTDDESVDENCSSSLKRQTEDQSISRPFKRQKGLLNVDYLDLLNREIEDAAQRVSLEDEHNLSSSQLGLNWWSALEKKVLFECVARMGRDNLEGIAAMISSKSVIEIRHYINALEEEQELRRKTDRRSTMTLSEYPAAIELSQQCCHALDEAADTVSVRQEGREKQREQKKWGDVWDLTLKVAKNLEEGDGSLPNDRSLPSAKLLHLKNLLKLSRHIFMNSSIPSSNWTYIDDVPPSIWATTFEDFYSLAVSITRRLVQTTIFTAMSRIRAKREYRPMTGNNVRREDVAAAIASLGMTANAKEFWQKSARRLRLEVYENLDDYDEADDPGPMTFSHVEEALSHGIEQDINTGAPTTELDQLSDDDAEDDVQDTSEGEASDEEEAAINREANEVLRYSAADFPETFKMRQALKNRIAMERQQERHAEQGDEYASYKEELEMWDILQKEPPMELPKKTDPGPPQRSTLDVESIFPLGRDWRGKMKYCSEWEVEGGTADA